MGQPRRQSAAAMPNACWGSSANSGASSRKRPQNSRRRTERQRGHHSSAERLIRTGGFKCGQPPLLCSKMSRLRRAPHSGSACCTRGKFTLSPIIRVSPIAIGPQGGAIAPCASLRALSHNPRRRRRSRPSCYYRLLFVGTSLPSVIWYTLYAVYALDPAATTIRASMVATIH